MSAESRDLDVLAEQYADATLARVKIGRPVNRETFPGAWECHRYDALRFLKVFAPLIEQARAEAWDEGWDERDNDCSEPYSPHKVNPYRTEEAGDE